MLQSPRPYADPNIAQPLSTSALVVDLTKLPAPRQRPLSILFGSSFSFVSVNSIQTSVWRVKRSTISGSTIRPRQTRRRTWSRSACPLRLGQTDESIYDQQRTARQSTPVLTLGSSKRSDELLGSLPTSSSERQHRTVFVRVLETTHLSGLPSRSCFCSYALMAMKLAAPATISWAMRRRNVSSELGYKSQPNFRTHK